MIYFFALWLVLVGPQEASPQPPEVRDREALSRSLPCPLTEEYLVLDERHLKSVRGYVYESDFPSERPPELYPFAGVGLALTSRSNSESRTYRTQADSEGYFDFTGVPPGDYLLETCLSGWNTVQVKVKLDPGGRPEILKLGIWPA
ncbi:MAG: carboxypeptidase regulatory-like domain-containing protein [Acidobacteria bacterium]|nr:carboxypeptidase regulatory-like domain-containing protein [Acidobacteriota bacterium]